MALDAYAWLARAVKVAAPVFPPGPVTAAVPVEPAPTPQQGQAPGTVTFHSPASTYTRLLAQQRADDAAKTAAQVDNTAEGDLVDHTWPERHAAMEQFFARHPQIIQKPAAP